MNIANILGASNGPTAVRPMAGGQPTAGQGPGAQAQPMAGGVQPAANPMALLSMGQQQLGRALGGNPHDANAMAEVIMMGLMGAQPRTPGFNPAGAL